MDNSAPAAARIRGTEPQSPAGARGLAAELLANQGAHGPHIGLVSP